MNRTKILAASIISLALLILTFCWLLVGARSTAAVFALRPATGQERGQDVRLRIGNANNGQEVELYAASYALVIGVSDYTNGWHDLPGVLEDLPAVKAALEKQGFKVTTLLNPTRRQCDDAVGQFIGAYGQRRDTRLLIYFAGHGHTLKTQDGRRQLGYIVPADAPLPKANDTGEFKRFAISMNEINNYAEQIEAIHALFVFDSCFAGTIFKARNQPVPEAITDKVIQPVRQFITAGNEKQTVPDYSYFRRAFVAALDGAADDSRDGFITGTELGEYLHREVTNYTKRAQTPQHGKLYNPDLNEGDLVFVAPKRATVTLIDPCASEADAWQQVRNSRNVAAVRAFLREYPNCQFAANARILLVTLEAPTPVARMSVAGVPLVAMSFTTANTDAQGRLVNRRTEQCWSYMEDLGGVALEMVEVPGGEFLMGTRANEDEGPPHRVHVPGFAMGKYEVTQAQWRAVAKLQKVKMDLNPDPANFKGDSLPVERVNWDEAVEFCERLKRQTGRAYRLPTEAEWEYAARAGTTTPFAFGPTVTPDSVNYDGNYPYGAAPKGSYRVKTVPVGSLGVANAFGLFDLHGNVWEWCQDVWHVGYAGAPTDGSAWLNGGDSSRRVLRGGSWNNYSARCRSAVRSALTPGDSGKYGGLRVVVSARVQ